MKQIFSTITALLVMVTIGHSQANKKLSNLNSPTAVNVNLLPAGSGGIDLGSNGNRWRNGYFNGSVTAYGVGGSYGVYGSGSSYGLYGSSGNIGVYGSGSAEGLYGQGGTYGVYGNGTSYGVRGQGGTYGVYGNGTSYGVRGISTDGWGVYGSSTNSYGVRGAGTIGVYGSGSDFGLYGSGGTYGVYGSGTSFGVRGSGGTYGVYGSGTSYGVRGVTTDGLAIYGTSSSNIAGRFHSTSFHGIWASENSTASNVYAGVFDANVYVFGSVTESSDKNIKKNIQDFEDAMSIINKLKPKNYEFRDDANYAFLNLPKGTHYGLIAQDLEEVLPNLVKECAIPSGIQRIDKPEDELKPTETLSANSKETIVKEEPKEAPLREKAESISIKGINYTELIPIMIKAMQQLDAENNKLKTEVAQLKDMMEKNTNVKSDASGLSGSYLSQNSPNPGNNTTVIAFRIPKESRSASLLITQTASGKIVKNIPVAIGTSQVTLETGSFASGAYTYSLLIDGKKVDTKQMLIER